MSEQKQHDELGPETRSENPQQKLDSTATVLSSVALPAWVVFIPNAGD